MVLQLPEAGGHEEISEWGADLQLLRRAVRMAARDDGGGAGSARRCRERRLCSFFRHERMAVAMALAESLHHSAPRGLEGRGGREMNYKGVLRTMPPLPPLPFPFQAAGAPHFAMDAGEDVGGTSRRAASTTAGDAAVAGRRAHGGRL